MPVIAVNDILWSRGHGGFGAMIQQSFSQYRRCGLLTSNALASLSCMHLFMGTGVKSSTQRALKTDSSLASLVNLVTSTVARRAIITMMNHPVFTESFSLNIVIDIFLLF